MNVLDIAQNSVRADAKNVSILITEDSAADILTIDIIDDGCGMTEEQVANVTDPFFTTRKTRKVGLGIPFFKMAAEMTGGEFEIRSVVGQGTTVHATFGLTHIDRMPMGDIAGTISCLMCLNEDINFIYTYTIDGNSFTAKTEEFKKVLEGVPMNDPSIMQFITSYLAENTDALK